MKKVIPVNTVFGVAKTVCAGYYKYGVQTLLTGDFGTTGTIVLEYEATSDGCAYGVKANYFKNAAITTLTGGGGHFPCTGILEIEDEEIE